METIYLLLKGFSVALNPENLLLCAVGVITGTLVGALPGIGSAGACAILLPATFKLGPVGSLIMLAGIFYGTQYGGTITSVLMNVPGESASVVTMFDGNPLAKQGRAGVALGLAAIGSFVGGTLSIVGLMLFGPVLANYALELGPAEHFSLMVLSLSLVCAFSGESIVRGLIATCFGLILALVGQDIMTGQPRLTFDFQQLLDGIEFLPVAVGMFGLSETIESFEKKSSMEIIRADLGFFKVLPSLRDLGQSFWAMVRGTVIGFLIGIFPGAGPTISSFISYGVEQRISRNPEQFGKGALAGVAGPETANNAATGGALVPMLSLGLPSSPSTAIMLAALIMFGLKPGPSLFREAPELVWGLIGSMYIGNVLLVIINLACIPLIVLFMDRIRAYLPLAILLLSAFGVYSYRNSVFDIGIMIFFALVGYGMRKVEFPQAPVILGVLLGGAAESSLRQAMVMSDGNPSIFVTRPLSAAFLCLTLASLILPPIFLRKRPKQD
ncbi:MAG TPA: tripartite tricarboxylate transporter permease [Thermodesulfobacteriota bacterium]|nr:tripartite tricarboxylate transporter permease [Thermodesulfobacteriota bacterium]